MQQNSAVTIRIKTQKMLLAVRFISSCSFSSLSMQTFDSDVVISKYDSTSTFHKTGKKKWFNTVKGNEEHCDALGLLGKSF